MSGEIKACEVKDWGKGQETWKPGWFYGLTEHLSGDRLVMRAVVRFPGSLLLEDVQLSDVRLTEDSPAPNPADEAELEEELRKTHNRLARLRGILVQVHSYLTNYQGSGLSEGVAEDLCKILDYPDPIMEDK